MILNIMIQKVQKFEFPVITAQTDMAFQAFQSMRFLSRGRVFDRRGHKMRLMRGKGIWQFVAVSPWGA